MRVMLCLAALLISLSARAEGAEVTPPPLKPGLAEGVETRLVQFEVRVSRKGTPVSGLGATDFDIELGGKPLTKFTVDDMCLGTAAPLPGVPPTRPGSYIFYFDEPELTVDGRHRAIEVARLVAPALLAHGHDIMILRNGYALRTDARWTHDPAVVTAALDRIATDPRDGDASRADFGEVNAERLVDQLAGAIRVAGMQLSAATRERQSRDANLPAAFQAPAAEPGTPGYRPSAAEQAALLQGKEAIAQVVLQFEQFAEDELRRIERDMERLRGAVRSLALRDAPKGLVYFSDTLRRDPGSVLVRTLNSQDHVTRFLLDPRWQAEANAWNADGDFQSLVREASTYGVRFYAVEGRNLSLPSN